MIRKLRRRPIALVWLALSMGWMWGLLLLIPRLFDWVSIGDLSLLESFFAAIGFAFLAAVGLFVYAVVAVWTQQQFHLALEVDREDG